MKSKNLIVVALILASSAFIHRDSTGKSEGTAGAVILIQPSGARAAAMGEAYTAISGDICGLHYNPAGLATLASRQISFLFHTGFAGDNLGTVVVGSATSIGVVAASFLYYTVGDMDLVDSHGNSRTVNAQQDYVATLSFSRNLVGKALSIGTNVKVLRSTIVEKSATALAMDLGILWAVTNEGLAIGMSVRNVGTELKYLEEGTPLPLCMTVGVSYKLPLFNKSQGLVAVDAVRLMETMKANVGLEYCYEGFLALRGGCELGDGFESFTSGLGLMIEKMNLNYSLMTMGELGLTHRISLTYSF